jgi:peptidoglycan/LPS O-acetylase OafA/YrhL
MEKAEAFHARYRPDIDGLRAVAVLAVVASHVQLHFFAGGYIGVDVFFVISGFLIGSILLREVAQTGHIDYLEFYERRIRRIMPALLAMLITVCCVAYGVLLPKDLKEFAEMAAATLLFSANLYLAHSGGYFGSEAGTNFLTHTWSLGVEEQFYIVLPPLLMCLRRVVLPGKLGRSIGWIAAISFAISVPSAFLAATGTFYYLPTRMWELLSGTLAYLYGAQFSRQSHRTQSVLAWIGLAAILLPLSLYSDQTVFPGLAALAPCAGAVLLIATGSTLVHRVLSWPVLVLIGQISYSIYLWHWPLVVYSRLYPATIGGGGRGSKVALLAISLAAGYISWRWIETPFRRGRLRPTRARLFSMMGGLSAILLILLGLLVATRGAEYRYSPAEQRIASYRQTGGSMETFRVGTCFIEAPSSSQLPNRTACLSLDPKRKNVLLLGSSFVAQMHAALEGTYPNVHFLQATSARCTVKDAFSKDRREGCPALMHFVLSDFLPHNHVDAVMLQVEPEDPDPNKLEAVLAFFRDHGTQVFVIGPEVQLDAPGPELAIASLRNPQGFRMASHLLGRPAQEDAIYRATTERGGATYLSMFEALCPGGACKIMATPAIPMETDRAHLSYAGSLFVARSWRDRDLLQVR